MSGSMAFSAGKGQEIDLDWSRLGGNRYWWLLALWRYWRYGAIGAI